MTDTVTDLTRICRDPDCKLAGEPQPIDNFQPHPKSSDGLMRVCRPCVQRKTLGVKHGVSQALPREDRRKSHAKKRTPRVSAVTEPLDALTDLLEQLAAGRPDRRRDLVPIFGPRTHREIAVEALKEWRRRSKSKRGAND